MDLSNAIPPPPRPPITSNPSELLALRFIVMSLVAIRADEYEKSGSGPAQSWINQLAVLCNEAITISPLDGRDVERMRRETLEHVNHILGGIRFPRQRDNTN
jgi:hypothetical protein